MRADGRHRSALVDHPAGAAPDCPTVAIVVPVYNEIAHIDQLGAELLAQDYPGIREIWFVDGYSSDGTFETMQRIQAQDCRIKVVRNPQRLPAAAMNLALRSVHTDLVMRLDAHASYERDVVRQSVRALLSTGAAGVGAIARPAPAHTPLKRAIVAAHKSPFGVGVAKFRKERAEGWADTIWNGCYWKHVLDRVGGPREDLWRAEDNDLNERIRRLGYGLHVSPAIQARYQARRSLGALWQQYFSNGIGVSLAFFANRRAFGLRHLAPLALVLCLLLPLALAMLWPPALLAAAGVVLLYAALMFSATVLAARTEPGMHILLLPITLAAIHLAYGFGSLWGLILRILGRPFWRNDRQSAVTRWGWQRLRDR